MTINLIIAVIAILSIMLTRSIIIKAQTKDIMRIESLYKFVPTELSLDSHGITTGINPRSTKVWYRNSQTNKFVSIKRIGELRMEHDRNQSALEAAANSLIQTKTQQVIDAHSKKKIISSICIVCIAVIVAFVVQ